MPDTREKIIATIPATLQNQFRGILVAHFGHTLSDSERKNDKQSLSRDWDCLQGTKEQYDAFYAQIREEYQATPPAP